MSSKITIRIAVFLLVACAAAIPAAADVIPPESVSGVTVDRSGDDVVLGWNAVSADIQGNGESIDLYHVYRGQIPSFVPDKPGASNRIGTPAGVSHTDTGAATDGLSYYYLVSAVDTSANEGNTRENASGGAPGISGGWTDTAIDVAWTAPPGDVAGYKVFYGMGPDTYDLVDDVGLTTAHSLTGLQTFVNWHIVVAAYDSELNLGPFSVEHVDAVAGRVRLRAHDDDELCWGAAKCPPDPGELLRSDGFQLLVPTTFPQGDWTRVLVTYTIDSQLCDPPAGGNVTKCGSGNPCVNPPCNGGYNTCGDPWDRLAHLFLVLDETCISGGGSCITDANLELMRAVTPFGTDADPPDGTGVVPPRELTLDITPFAPQLTGTKYVGTHIGHFVQTGWRVTVDFEFSERMDEASPKPPADGFQNVFFRGGGEILTPTQVNVPASAQQVYGRFFITGHGGNARCDGGFNDGLVCDNGCPGGSCQNCDEFCHRDHDVKVDGATAWSVEPWRDDCSPGGPAQCRNWNACGTCRFPRAGWCPGYIACHHESPCDQDIDLTHKLLPGGTYDMTWEISTVNGSWSKSVAVYWYDSSTETCGNGVREGSELCDGGDTGSVTCADQAWDAGPLGCNGTCDGYDETACRFFECGNSVCEAQAGEDCLSCDVDCNGTQNGNPSNKYCCGDGDGENPTYCTDGRCNIDGNTCEP